MDQLSTVKDFAIILAGVIALTTFFSGVLEYNRQGRSRRAEHFVDMRRRFLENDSFRQTLNLLPGDDVRLKEISIQDRRNFIGFLEEVALMVNSKIIRREVAHYMFGYYVGLAEKSEHLWEGLDKNSVYWTVFREFAHALHDVKGTPPESHRIRV
jgi:hypothetical protein